MKISYLKLSAGITILMASATGFMNWLWLMGFVVKPSEDIIDARWLYTLAGYVVAGFMLAISDTHE